jgi:hypothetical protein
MSEQLLAFAFSNRRGNPPAYAEIAPVQQMAINRKTNLFRIIAFSHLRN